jgi:hypothetical protein
MGISEQGHRLSSRETRDESGCGSKPLVVLRCTVPLAQIESSPHSIVSAPDIKRFRPPENRACYMVQRIGKSPDPRS